MIFYQIPLSFMRNNGLSVEDDGERLPNCFFCDNMEKYKGF